jgi:hypothetical protein
MASTFPGPDHDRVHALRIAVIAAAALGAAGGAGAAAPSFHLVFDGRHNAALLHDGTFTTSSAWCLSGTATDVSVDDGTLTATRRFTCNGGGEFTALVRPLDAEHGGSGSWQIVSGSGALVDLRGKGTFSSTRLTGDPGNPASLTFRSTWDGLADLDAAAPTVAVTSSSIKKLRGLKTTYSVRLVLSIKDSGGGPVSYTLEVTAPGRPASPLVYRQATTPLETVTSSFRVKLPATTRRLRVKIGATDPLGNTSALAATIRVP